MVVGERAGDSQCPSRPMQLPAADALVAPCPEQLMRDVSPKDTKEVGRTIASELGRCRLRRRPSILRRLKRRVEVSAQDSRDLEIFDARVDVAGTFRWRSLALFVHGPRSRPLRCWVDALKAR